MKRVLFLFPLVFLLGCPKDKNARDVDASLKGLIQAAQAKYQSTCQNNRELSTCQTINRAVATENTLITATEMYCGFSSTTAMDVPCQPVTSMQSALNSAVVNANQAIKDIQGILKP